MATLAQQLSELNVTQDQLKSQVISLTLQLEHATAHNASLQQAQNTTLLDNERLKQRLLEFMPKLTRSSLCCGSNRLGEHILTQLCTHPVKVSGEEVESIPILN